MFDVRPATFADVDPLTILWQANMEERASYDRRFQLAESAVEEWRAAFHNWLQQDNVQVLVAEKEGQLIGYVIGWVLERPLFHLQQRYGFISDLGVDGHAHQGGVGKALFNGIKPWFSQQEVGVIEIQVMHQHPIAQAFWRSRGATEYLDHFWYSLRD
ncbi:MAG: GNAT family N-acetyltransferase [Anaerolineales bacterium]|nr:GNAT family N-acetyltransferase [Anaerolineales bacterium]